MACYHFTLKHDRKPNGAKVSAVTHVEYIDREGKYKDYDQSQNNTQSLFKNSILGDKPIENTLQESMLLYHSLFGSIMRTKDGITVSDGSSVETVAIALAITENLYGGKVHLNGTDTFKGQVLVAANEMDVPLHFADLTLEKKYIKMLEEKEHERTEFKRIGGSIRKPQNLPKSDLKQRTFKAVAKTGFSLSKLPECRLVFHDKEADMLLPGDDAANLRYQGSKFYRNVRWDVSGARRERVKKIASKILVHVQNQLDSVFAASHVEYINREAAFKQRGGCIYKNHHLPKWANNSPKYFFAMADAYERINGVRYREIEFALPNELNLEQQKEIIDSFIENHLKDFYYTYAVHDKIGVMSDGEHNTHVHIMFSERKLDSREKQQERSPEEFFARASFSEKKGKQTGGCPKDEKWDGKDRAKYLSLMREDFAKIQNAILEKYDVPDCVDHRLIKVQMEEALANGNTRLAELLDRMPEEHIGPDNALRKNNKKVVELKKYRAYKAEHQKLLYATDLMENSIAEDIEKQETLHNTKKVAEITRLEEYKKAQETSFTALRVLKNDMLHALKDVNALNKIVLWNKDAIAIAKLKFMTPDEKELWQSLKSLQKEKEHWLIFKNNLKEPASYQQEELEAYHNLLPELNRKLNLLNEQIKIIASKVEPVSQRLASPIMQKKIQKETARLLWEDKTTKEKLSKANEQLNSSIEKLQQKIDTYTETINDKVEETTFTSKQLQEILSASYDHLKLEYNRNQIAAKKLESRVISYDRAIAMAKDVYTHGEFKKLREQYLVLEKKTQYISDDKIVFNRQKQEFAEIEKPRFWQNKQLKSDYEAKQQALVQKAGALLQRTKELAAEKDYLIAEKSRLNVLYERPGTKSKIEAVAMGILRKNQPITVKYKDLMGKLQDSLKKIKHTKKQLQAIKKQAAVDQKDTQYTIVENHGSSGGGSYSKSPVPSIIADAILGEPKAVQLVARSKPGSGEMEKDWNMMTEIEKDEKLNSIENLDRD
jgi:hypothetical protein